MARLRAERMESLGRLAGKVAHDFNNMLGVVVNYANFVIEEAESGQPDVSAISADARQIIRAGERGADLTQQLLAFAGRAPVQPSPVDLNKVISATLRPELSFQPDSDIPPAICDPSQLSRLVDILVSGGRLVIDTARQGDRVRLRVSDPDSVMSAAELSRAFEPFALSSSSLSPSGLGLAMAYGIVTQAGGEIGIESSPGKGTTVTVLLPASPSSP